MKRILTPLLLVAIFILSATSCVKESPDSIFLSTEVSFKTQHHERAVPFIDVYIKYGATEFPGYEDRTVFDTMIVSDQYGDVTFPTVPLGSNWVVAFGEDELLQEPVRGSLPFEVVSVVMPWDTTLYVSEY